MSIRTLEIFILICNLLLVLRDSPSNNVVDINLVAAVEREFAPKSLHDELIKKINHKVDWTTFFSNQFHEECIMVKRQMYYLD